MKLIFFRRLPKTLTAVFGLFAVISFIEFSLSCDSGSSHFRDHAQNPQLSDFRPNRHSHDPHSDRQEGQVEHEGERGSEEEHCCENVSTIILPPSASAQISLLNSKLNSLSLTLDFQNTRFDLSTPAKQVFTIVTGNDPPKKNLAIHIQSTILRI